MKKFLLTLLAMLPLALATHAEDSLPNSLVVYLNNGTVQEYPLQDWPEITFDGTDMVINCATTTTIITRDEINRYEFEIYGMGNVDVPTGDKNVVRRGNEIYVSNVTPGAPVTIYTIDGRLLLSTVANAQGEVCVSLDGFGAGIYLFTVNNFTTKIIKR